ncbi:hypothetical protein G6F57_020920 [Rhizopus arrhizus]|nr:hypothetical protein G6F57_020920 [Rhizopus arrhizus]
MPTREAAAVDRYLTAAPVHAQAAFLGLSPALQANSAAQIAAFLAALPATAGADAIAAGHAAAQALQSRLESLLSAGAAPPAVRTLREDGARAPIPAAVLAANLAGPVHRRGLRRCPDDHRPRHPPRSALAQHAAIPGRLDHDQRPADRSRADRAAGTGCRRNGPP